ncbi:MAG: caspase family protein [Planctomycetota bacterium]
MPSRALICGINNYKEISDLRGCVNDAHAMRRLLVDQFGFSPDQVEVLLDAQVTKRRIKDKWEWLIRGARPGDHLVFFIAGHGSQVAADLDESDDEPDLKDEILCMYDMDATFRDKSGFLRDDELRRLIERVPSGVELTAITDTCHSATVTRFVAQQKTSGTTVHAVIDDASERSLGRTPDTVGTHEVLARYYPPPREFAPKEGVRRRLDVLGGSRDIRASMRHLHFSACRDHQTAADASIDGVFCGAFTHHFCKAIRDNPGADSRALSGIVARMVRDAGFWQEPQSEGVTRSAPIFGIRANEGGTSTDGPASPTVGKASAAPANASDRDTDLLVCVHGIGNHQPGYSDRWFQALAPHTGHRFGSGVPGQDRFEVYWADLVNSSRSLEPTSRDDAEELDLLRTELALELAEHELWEATRATGEHPEDRDMPDDRTLSRSEAPAAVSRGLPQFDDFLKYLFSPAIRRRVLDRFHEVMDNALLEGRRVQLISHSWGTVVAHEGLLERANGRGTPRDVVNHFTLGAALDFRTVRIKLGLRNEKPAQVRRWYNLNARGDIVGGPLRANFPITREYTGLPAPGCGWLDVACRHDAYFNRENPRITRDILAHHMTEEQSGGAAPARPGSPRLSGPSQLRGAIEAGVGFARAMDAAARDLSPVARGGGSLLLAEGDSWFDFPFTDVLCELEDVHGYDVRSVAHKGDTIESMAYHGQLAAFGRLARKHARRGETPAAVLVSGGGNDFAGPELAMLLNHSLSPDPGLAMGAVRDVFHNRIRLAHATVLSGVIEHCRLAFGREIPVLVHGYDYAVPDGRGVFGLSVLPGPWLEPVLRAKGFRDLEEGRTIIRTLIDELNSMLRDLTREDQFSGIVHHVDLRDTLLNDSGYRRDWQDELHPTRTGFRKVARAIHQKIIAL